MATPDTCAFVGCDAVTECCLVGGCVRRRFGPSPTKRQSELRKGARALAGSKPARTQRDPA